MDINQIFDDLAAKLQDARQALQDEKAASFAAGKDEGYKAGYADGQGSIVLPDSSDPKPQYTQADVDQIVVNTKAEKDAEFQPQVDKLTADVAAAQAQVTELSAQVADLTAKLDVLNAGLDAQAEVKFVALKADLKAKYDELQVVESESETGFGDLLN